VFVTDCHVSKYPPPGGSHLGRKWLSLYITDAKMHPSLRSFRKYFDSLWQISTFFSLVTRPWGPAVNQSAPLEERGAGRRGRLTGGGLRATDVIFGINKIYES